MKRIIVIAIATAVLAVACGDSEAPADPTDALGNGAAGACLVGDPNCNDTPGFLGDDPVLDEEPGPGSEGPSLGLVIDGGLSVAEALATDATGVLAVQGFVVADETGIRLCDALAESRPPLCGGASVELSDLTTIDPDSLVSEQGVTWTDQPVTVLGEMVAGVLVVDPLSS